MVYNQFLFSVFPFFFLKFLVSPSLPEYVIENQVNFSLNGKKNLLKPLTLVS